MVFNSQSKESSQEEPLGVVVGGSKAKRRTSAWVGSVDLGFAPRGRNRKVLPMSPPGAGRRGAPSDGGDDGAVAGPPRTEATTVLGCCDGPRLEAGRTALSNLDPGSKTEVDALTDFRRPGRPRKRARSPRASRRRRSGEGGGPIVRRGVFFCSKGTV